MYASTMIRNRRCTYYLPMLAFLTCINRCCYALVENFDEEIEFKVDWIICNQQALLLLFLSRMLLSHKLSLSTSERVCPDRDFEKGTLNPISLRFSSRPIAKSHCIVFSPLVLEPPNKSEQTPHFCRPSTQASNAMLRLCGSPSTGKAHLHSFSAFGDLPDALLQPQWLLPIEYLPLA